MPNFDEAVQRSLRGVWTGRKQVGLGLQGGGEVTDSAYRRQDMEFSAPKRDGKGYMVESTGMVQFAPMFEARGVVDRLIIYENGREIGAAPIAPFVIVERLAPFFDAGSVKIRERVAIEAE